MLLSLKATCRWCSSQHQFDFKEYKEQKVKRQRRPLWAKASIQTPLVQSQTNTNYAISVKDLNHTFSNNQVLRNTEFQVSRGELHILAGANGCGKSTLLRILGGLLPQQSGDIHIDHPIGIVIQNPDHQIVMPTVSADVGFGLGRYNLSKGTVRELVKEALATVGLEDYGDRPTNTLSGGEKQRVAIAGALVQSPKILLLDELTTFLDAAGQESVMKAVRSAVNSKRNVTAVWVTHRLEELEWADSASFMDGGKIRVSGPPELVISHMRSLGATV